MPGKLGGVPAKKRRSKGGVRPAAASVAVRAVSGRGNGGVKDATAISGGLRQAGAPGGSSVNVRGIREGYGVSRSRFHRLSGFSERALANWESGVQAPDENTRRRLVELDRLRGALAQVIRPGAIAEWLDTPNPAFASLKPIEVAERGESDRLWRMIFEIESGMPV